jgi:RND superfamily putative drug exporter
VVLAVAGVLTLSSTNSGFTHTFATPGTPGYNANHNIQQRFGIDGNEQPTIAVLHLPPGQSMHSAAGQATAARTFAAIPRAGHVAVADYANTQNPKLISRDGRTTWALVNMPNPDIPLGTGAMDRIPHVLRAAAPPAASVSVTGFEQLQVTGGGSSRPPRPRCQWSAWAGLRHREGVRRPVGGVRGHGRDPSLRPQLRRPRRT